MSVVQFFPESFRTLHNRLDDALRDLTDEELHFRPAGKGNHIAFTIWHYVRTEDNVIQGAIQGKPSLWVSGEFDKKLGLDANAQGTGMSAEDAGNVRLSSLAEFLAYQRRVWEATDAYLASIDDLKLEETRPLGRRGPMPVRQLVGSILLTHGYTHAGEIDYIRGLRRS